jgi:lipid-A-disaccharide synthase
MQSAGATLLRHIDDLSAMGFVESLSAVPRHYRLYRQLLARAKEAPYAAAVLIDYPGFHLRLGRALRRRGIPVLQFVAPQLWAWRPGRIELLRRAATMVATILPFEEQWLRARGVAARYVGHPLLDQSRPAAVESGAGLQVVAGQRVLSIFPGSRAAELQRHWPLFRAVGQRLLAAGRCDRVLVAAVAGQAYPEAGPLTLIFDRSAEVMAVATAALIKSGTTTLEAALAGVPHVVAYNATWSTYRIARALMTVDRISLVNLVGEREVVPEFWHLPVTADQLEQALVPLLGGDSPARTAQRDGLAQVVRRLGAPGATDRVAALVEGMLTA